MKFSKHSTGLVDPCWEKIRLFPKPKAPPVERRRKGRVRFKTLAQVREEERCARIDREMDDLFARAFPKPCGFTPEPIVNGERMVFEPKPPPTTVVGEAETPDFVHDDGKDAQREWNRRMLIPVKPCEPPPPVPHRGVVVYEEVGASQWDRYCRGTDPWWEQSGVLPGKRVNARQRIAQQRDGRDRRQDAEAREAKRAH